MTEAMQMVRDTLGDDAVIVATREERGGAVHLTAAIEPAFELGHGGIAASSEDWLQYDSEDEELAISEELTEAMLRHAVSEDVMDNILSCASVVGMDSPEIALAAALEHLFQFKPLPIKATPKAQMFVGAPGAGKTLAVAKMAARGAMAGMNIGVISCDVVRAGGVEQLESFTNLLHIDLQRAETANDLKHIIKDLRNCDQILIDTAGVNPFNQDDMRDLARLIGADDLTVHLVAPAGIDTEESAEMARAFSAIGTHSLVATRIDIARRLGGLLAAAHHGNLSFADASNTPKVAEGLFAFTPKALSQLLLPGAFKTQTQARKTGSNR